MFGKTVKSFLVRVVGCSSLELGQVDMSISSKTIDLHLRQN